MKTPVELIEGLDRVESEEHPKDKASAWESFVREIQLDACQSNTERILELIAERGIDVSNCDGDDEPAEILANWVVGRIEQLQEENRELEKRYEKLAQRYDQLQNSF